LNLRRKKYLCKITSLVCSAYHNKNLLLSMNMTTILDNGKVGNVKKILNAGLKQNYFLIFS